MEAKRHIGTAVATDGSAAGNISEAVQINEGSALAGAAPQTAVGYAGEKAHVSDGTGNAGTIEAVQVESAPRIVDAKSGQVPGRINPYALGKGLANAMGAGGPVGITSSSEVSASQNANQGDMRWRESAAKQHMNRFARPSITSMLFPGLKQPQGVVGFLEHTVDWKIAGLDNGSQAMNGGSPEQARSMIITQKLLPAIQKRLGPNKLTPEQLARGSSLSRRQQRVINETLIHSGIPLSDPRRTERVLYQEAVQEG